MLSSALSPTGEYIGRPAEIAELRAHLQRAAAGSGRLILLAGEPGIGKTRTCEQLACQAQRMAMMVLWGRCWEAGGASAYWPWIQVLRSLLTSIPPARLGEWTKTHSTTIARLLPQGEGTPAAQKALAGDSPQERFQLFEGVAAVIRWAAQSRPLLILLDDLQGADLPSLLLLEFIARDIANAPVLVVGTYREVAAATGSALIARLPELTREPAVRRITLRPLDAAEVASFVSTVVAKPVAPSVIATLQQLTDGNPLFLLECLRAIGNEEQLDDLAKGRARISLGIRSAVHRHLAPLSADCRALLRAAAVFGREFGIVALRNLIRYADEVLLAARLDEAVHMEILTTDRTGPGRYRFVHVLVRDVLYADLDNVELLRHHHDAGTELASRVDAEANLTQIAHHFVEAARRGAHPEPAVSWARRAGDRALSLFAYEEADRLYGLGLEILDQFGPDDRQVHAELLLARGSTYNRLGEIERAKQIFGRAVELARTMGSRELLARAALGHGEPLTFPEGGYVDGPYVALLEDALAAWNGEAHPLHARLLSRLASALYFTDQAERRRDLCTRALQMARDAGDGEALGHVLLAAHAALWGANAEERLQLADELLRLIGRTGDRSLAFAAHHWRYCDLLELGRVAAMEDEFQSCRALAAELREPAMSGWIDIFRAGRAMWEGRFDECERLVNDNLGLARWLGNAAQTTYFLQLFHLRTLQGRCDEMLEPMRMVAGLNPSIPAFSIGLAFIHAENGRLEEARPLAAGVVAHLDRYPADINCISTLTCLGLVCARLGDAALTTPVYERTRRYEKLSIMIGTGFGYCGSAAHWLGVMAASLGRCDDAAAHFEHALASQTSVGSPPWVANTQCEYAAMLLARGEPSDRDRAASLLAQATATAERLGMAGLLARAQPRAPGAGASTAAPSVEPPVMTHTGSDASVFRREGDFWTIEHNGHTLRLRDSRGLHYLARLLRHPHREFLVLDLAAEGIDVAHLPLGRATEYASRNGHRREPVADRRAIVEYKQRLEGIRSELVEAEANNDAGRASALRGEMDALVAQLSSAIGLRGQQRAVSIDLERARSAVTKRIRDALKRLQEESPLLGRHLVQNIQTGYFCTYAPAPTERIHWSF